MTVGHCERSPLPPPGGWGLTLPGAGMGAGTASAAGSNAGGRCDSSFLEDGVKVVDIFGNQPKLHDGMVGRNVLILDAGNCMAQPRFLYHATQI